MGGLGIAGYVKPDPESREYRHVFHHTGKGRVVWCYQRARLPCLKPEFSEPPSDGDARVIRGLSCGRDVLVFHRYGPDTGTAFDRARHRPDRHPQRRTKGSAGADHAGI